MQQLSNAQKKLLKIICFISKLIYRIYLFTKIFVLWIFPILKELIVFIYHIIKPLLTLLLILGSVFILPLFLNALIKINIFNNLEEFKDYFNVFFNKYVIIYIVIGFILISISFGDLSKNLKNIASKITKISIELFRQ